MRAYDETLTSRATGLWKKRPRGCVAVAATLLSLTAVGCAQNAKNEDIRGETALVTQSPRGSESGFQSTKVDRGLVSKLYSGTSFRYFPFDQTKQLANESAVSLALVGEVSGYAPGPDYTPEIEGGSGRTVIMSVRPVEVFDGILDDRGTVSVVLLAPLAGADAFEAAMPTGTPTALYLAPENQLNQSPSAPSLYLPVSPQGFVVETSNGVVFPQDDELNSPDSLDEQVPNAVDVP